MLSEKECKRALENMHCPIINTMTEEMAYETIKSLIKEHFDLFKKIEWLKEEMTESTFNLVFSTQEFLHSWYKGIQITSAENAILQRKLNDYENPQPYKFEDLKPNMVVFDRDFYGCGELLKIIETKTNEFGEQIIKAYEFGSMNINALRYKENRFFPVTKAMEYQK